MLQCKVVFAEGCDGRAVCYSVRLCLQKAVTGERDVTV